MSNANMTLIVDGYRLAVPVDENNLVTVGRGEGSNVVLSGVDVHRDHAHLRGDAGGWSVSRRGVNPVLLDSFALPPYPPTAVHEGHVLGIGSHSVEVVTLPPVQGFATEVIAARMVTRLALDYVSGRVVVNLDVSGVGHVSSLPTQTGRLLVLLASNRDGQEFGMVDTADEYAALNDRGLGPRGPERRNKNRERLRLWWRDEKQHNSKRLAGLPDNILSSEFNQGVALGLEVGAVEITEAAKRLLDNA